MRLSPPLAGLLTTALASGALAEDEVTIEILNAKFMEDFAKDPGSVVKYYTSNATSLLGKASVITNQEQRKAYWAEAGKAVTDFKLQAIDVQRLGPDSVQEIGKFTYKAKGSADFQPGFGKYIVIWRKEGDTWKVRADVWSEDK